MSRNGLAAEKTCQKTEKKHEKDVVGVTVATALLNFPLTGSPKAEQVASVGIVLPEQLGMPLLLDFHVPTSGYPWAPAYMATLIINPSPCQLLCILSNWLQQGGVSGSCFRTSFPNPVVRLQEFVLIPGTVKFDFVYAAVNPWSSPEDCSDRAQNETIITLPFRAGLPT